MLLRTMFLLALLSLIGETIVHGAGALARTTLHYRALGALRAQLISTVSLEQATIARAIAANQDPRSVPVPTPSAACVLSDATGCRLLAHAEIALPSAAPLATPSACPGSDCTAYLQANDSVAEGRIPVTVSAKVTSMDGTVLATRNASVTFRTFNTAPYAVLAGSLDATLDDIARKQNDDDGGATSGATTLVNVEYVNAANPAATPIPGNVWRPQDENPATTATTWDY